MDECPSVEPLLAAFARNALAPPDRARVEEHVGECGACAHLLTALRDAGDSAADAASSARGTALPGPATRRPRSRRRATMLVAGAASVIAIAGVAAIGVLVPRGSVLTARLTLDHLVGLLLMRPGDGDASPEALSEAWYGDHGWTVTVPAARPADRLQLIGMRRCLPSEGDVAHVLYARGGHSVSLFVRRGPGGHRPAELAIMGYQTVAWTRGGRLYAVVGDLQGESLDRVVAYLREHAR